MKKIPLTLLAIFTATIMVASAITIYWTLIIIFSK